MDPREIFHLYHALRELKEHPWAMLISAAVLIGGFYLWPEGVVVALGIVVGILFLAMILVYLAAAVSLVVTAARKVRS
jgi:hypothetical protein